MKSSNKKSAKKPRLNIPPGSLKKFPLYFYILTLLLPVFFFILLELSLRVFSYGQSIPQWVPAGKELPGYIMLNPNIARRYFHQFKSVPAPPVEPFRQEKKENGFRVFVMGGSSAAGFPYPNTGAFSRFIKHYLEFRYPESEIEVINLAISAVSTYTLRDLLPGVIDQKPDLVLFYAGHNEYYGALGAGSTEFIGSIRPLVNFMIKIQDLRSVQLVQNIIMAVSRVFTPARRSPVETLMARMAGEPEIPLHSAVYDLGLKQFAGNMNDMLYMLKKNQIPVSLGTLTCNLRDQAPFVSTKSDSLPTASAVFSEAEGRYRQGEYQRALNLFRRARDLDGLRFRAPEQINSVIKDLAARYDLPVIDIDSLFCRVSINGITGNELITDHVHPTSGGHQLIGSAFVGVMEQSKNVPAGSTTAVTFEQAVQLAGRVSTLTRLDSVFAGLRIGFLKSGWPFKPGRMPRLTAADFTPQDYPEELALSMFLEEINWEAAHLKAALWYKGSNRIVEFEKEMAVLADYLPSADPYYMILIDGLLEKKNIVYAYPYIRRMHRHHPGAYSAKWLGIYYLFMKDYQQAVSLLEYSAVLNAKDPQLHYNLAGAYVYTGDYGKALQTIEKCLAIQADFPGAAVMHRDLLRVANRKK